MLLLPPAPILGLFRHRREFLPSESQWRWLYKKGLHLYSPSFFLRKWHLFEEMALEEKALVSSQAIDFSTSRKRRTFHLPTKTDTSIVGHQQRCSLVHSPGERVPYVPLSWYPQLIQTFHERQRCGGPRETCGMKTRRVQTYTSKTFPRNSVSYSWVLNSWLFPCCPFAPHSGFNGIVPPFFTHTQKDIFSINLFGKSLSEVTKFKISR